jgi:hypothetical protein
MAVPKREDITRSGSVVVFLSILIVLVIVAGVYLLRDYEDRNTYIPERIEDIQEFLGLSSIDYNFTPKVAGISTKVNGQYSKFNIPVDYSVRTQPEKSSIETKSMEDIEQLPDLNNLTSLKVPVIDYKQDIVPVKNLTEAEALVESEDSLAVINQFFPKKGVVLLCSQRSEPQGNCPDTKTLFEDDIIILQDRFSKAYFYKIYKKQSLNNLDIRSQIPDGSLNRLYLIIQDGQNVRLIKAVML